MNRVILPDRPYPGLRPFSKDEWPIFFGREQIVDEVLGKVAEQQLVVVHGSSGCGKSSLIRAGVLPSFEQEISRYGQQWLTASMKPGASPLWNLATALARLHEKIGDDATPTIERVRSIRRILDNGQSALAQLDDAIGFGEGGSICLLLDQFEEIFRFAREFGREEVDVLVAVLRGFAQEPPKSVHMIVTMRSDYLGDCAQFDGFAELVNETQYLLPRMDKFALMRAIRKPAELFGGGVSPDLTLRLIEESRQEPDALPLVQHALMRLWQQAVVEDRAGREPWPILEADSYRGLKRLLSEHADEVFERLTRTDPRLEATTEFLFRALSEIDRDGRAIRRPMRRSDLIKATGDDEARLNAVIDAFTDANTGFLAVSDEDDPVVDIGHEALLRCWKRLDDPTTDRASNLPKGWLQREMESGQIWQSLLFRADQAELIQFNRIDERARWLETLPKGWAERYGGGRDAVDALVVRSREARDQKEEEGRRQREHELALERKAKRKSDALAKEQQTRREEAERSEARLRRYLIVAVIGSLVAGLSAVAAFSFFLQRTQAIKLMFANESRGLAASATLDARKGYYLDATHLALAAWPRASDDRRPMERRTLDALGEAFSNQLQLLPTIFNDEPVWSVALSRDETMILIGGGSQDPEPIGMLKLFDVDVTAGKVNYPPKLDLRFDDGPVWSASFSPDETRIVIGGGGSKRPGEVGIPGVVEQGYVRVIGTETGKRVIEPIPHDGSVRSASFSPDGSKILTGSGSANSDEPGYVRLLDATTGKDVIDRIPYSEGPVNSAVFSRNGKAILTGSGDFFGTGYVGLISSETSEPLIDPIPHKDKPVWSAVFNQDETKILTSAGDAKKPGIVTLFDAADRSKIVPRLGLPHDRPVHAAVFGRNGDVIVTSSDDGFVRLFQAGDGREMPSRMRHGDLVRPIALNADHTRILSGAGDGTVKLFDAAFGRQSIPAMGADNNLPMREAIFSNNGGYILTRSVDGKARLYDASTGEALCQIEHERPEEPDVVGRPGRSGNKSNAVGSAVFSDDDRSILTGSHNGTVKLTDIGTCQTKLEIELSPEEGPVWKAKLNRDASKILISAGETIHGEDRGPGWAKLFDAKTGQDLLSDKMRHERGVWDVHFSADEGKILTRSEDGTARLFDAITGEQIHVFEGETEEDDGLEGSGADGECDNRSGGVRIETVTFSPDETKVLTGSQDCAARLFDVETGAQLGPTMKHGGWVRDASFNGSGDRILTRSEDGAARLFSAGSADPAVELAVLDHDDFHVRTAVFSRDEAIILTSDDDGKIRRFDVEKCLREYRESEGRACRAEEPVIDLEGEIFGVVFNGDETRLLVSSEQGYARVFDVMTGQPLTPRMAHQGPVRDASFNHDETKVLTYAEDGAARLWDISGLPKDGGLFDHACRLYPNGLDLSDMENSGGNAQLSALDDPIICKPPPPLPDWSKMQ